MSIHPSLRSSSLKRQRSVLKRYERIKSLQDGKKWKDSDSAFGLPKIKTIKIKIKKGKAAAAEGTPKAEETAAAAGAKPEAAPQSTGASKKA